MFNTTKHKQLNHQGVNIRLYRDYGLAICNKPLKQTELIKKEKFSELALAALRQFHKNLIISTNIPVTATTALHQRSCNGVQGKIHTTPANVFRDLWPRFTPRYKSRKKVAILSFRKED